MTLDDFDRLTPGEFGSVVRNARRVRRDREISELAMVRLHAAICVQPHISKPISPADLFSIPEIDSRQEIPHKALSREEQHAEYIRLLEERKMRKNGQ